MSWGILSTKATSSGSHDGLPRGLNRLSKLKPPDPEPRAAVSLMQVGLVTQPVVDALVALATTSQQLHDEDDDVTAATATTLATSVRQHPDVSDGITRRLVETCTADTPEHTAYDPLSEIISAT